MAFKKLTDEEKAAAKAAREALKADQPEGSELPEEGADEPVDDEAPLQAFRTDLSDAQKKRVTDHAKAKVQKELTQKAQDDYLASELARLRADAGISKPSALGGTHDELVTFTLDLVYEGAAFLQINQPFGKCYYHGGTYTEPRHIFNTLNEMAFRGAQLTAQVKGESVYRNRRYNTRIGNSGAKHEVMH